MNCGNNGIIAGDDAVTGSELLLNPFQAVSGFEPLGRLGVAAVLLHGDDVSGQMHVQRDFE
jgi:hypothetical protein